MGRTKTFPPFLCHWNLIYTFSAAKFEMAKKFSKDFRTHRSPCPLILKIWCLLGNSHCLLLLVLWLITLWRVWNPRGSEAREILKKGHFYFLLSLTHSFSTKLCTLVSRAWTTMLFVFVLSTVLYVPTFMHVKSCCKQKCTPWITKDMIFLMDGSENSVRAQDHRFPRPVKLFY